MNIGTSDLETRVVRSVARRTPRITELVSNMNDIQTGKLMDLVLHVDKKLGVLEPGKQIILTERNPDFLHELSDKLIQEFCPLNVLTCESHNQYHYVVRDGKVETYTNLDRNSQVVGMEFRLKHTDSTIEKLKRRYAQFGRVSERHDRRKLMVGDIYGARALTRSKEDVNTVVNRLLDLPYLQLEHREEHRKPNGYNATHLNVKYNNGNPWMKGLEVEIQVIDINTHLASIHDPRQAHSTTYGAEKMASEHKLPDCQVVMVGNGITIPDGLCQIYRVDGLVVAEIPHKMQQYLLIMPEQHQ